MMMMSKRWRLVTILLSGAVALPVLAQDAGGGPVPISLATLSSIQVYPERDAPAVAVTLNDTHLDAEIAGVIAAIEARVGDRVKRGQVVARVECEPYRIKVSRMQAALEAGRSSYAFAQRQFENARQLSQKRSISQEENDRREAEARTLKADVDRLSADLQAAAYDAGKCEIQSPIDAVIVERIASVGDYVVPGTPILRLLDDQNIEISAKVQEQDLDSLKSAQSIDFVSRNARYPVKLRTVLPLMETRLRTYEVRLAFAENRSALAGETGRLRWILGRGEVPADLIVQRGTTLGLFVVDEDKAKFIALPDARMGHPAAVDLPPETKVIVDGRYQLRDGDAVRLP